MFWVVVVFRLGLGVSALVISGNPLVAALIVLFYGGPLWAGFLLIVGVVTGVAGVWVLVRVVKSLRARWKQADG